MSMCRTSAHGRKNFWPMCKYFLEARARDKMLSHNENFESVEKKISYTWPFRKMTHIQRVVTHGCLRLSTQHIKETRRNIRKLRLRELVTLDDFLSTKRILVFSQNLNARGFLFTERWWVWRKSSSRRYFSHKMIFRHLKMLACVLLDVYSKFCSCKGYIDM